jgi:nitrate/nitrite transporter NarK
MLGSLTTVFGLLVGPLIDKLGCRSSLIVGAILSLLSRVGIAMATSTWVLWIR